MSTHNPSPLFVLRKHEDTVNEILLTDARLLSCSADGKVILWNITNRRPVFELLAHDGSTVSASLVGDQFITSGRDGYIKLWDTAKATVVSHLESGCLHFCRVKIVQQYPDSGCLVASADNESNMLLWDTRSPTLAAILTADGVKKSDLLRGTSNSSEAFGMLSCIQPSPGYGFTDHIIACGFEEGSVLIADIRMMRYITGQQKGSAPILTMAITSRCDELIAGGGDSTIHRFAIGTNADQSQNEQDSISNISFAEYGSFPLSSPGVSEVVYRSDDKVIAMATWDRTVRLYRRKKMKPLLSVTYHREGAAAVTFSKSIAVGWQFASGGKDGNIAVWDLESTSYEVDS